MNNQLKIFLILLLVLLALGLAAAFRPKSNRGQENALDSFARCLTDKGIVMYGADWCPHCQNEKKAFGDSFKYVNYVECTQETQECLERKIDGYPTWIFSDGRRLVGEQGIEKLSLESECSYINCA